jgi:1-acyl-sn-glycerol-3-phosphate acyltransferase
VVVLRSWIFAAVHYIVTALFLLLGSWLLLAPRFWAMQALAMHAKTSLWLLEKICGTKFEVRGRERLPHGACLIVSKHQSMWDTFALIPLLRDPAIVLKDELKWIPFYGWFCLKFEHILVKRDKASVATRARAPLMVARSSFSRKARALCQAPRPITNPATWRSMKDLACPQFRWH